MEEYSKTISDENNKVLVAYKEKETELRKTMTEMDRKL